MLVEMLLLNGPASYLISGLLSIYNILYNIYKADI